MPNRDSIPGTKKPKIRFTFFIFVVGLCTIFSVWLVAWYLNGSLKLAYKDSAIGILRTVVRDENTFAVAHPTSGYTCELSDLTTHRAATTNGQENGYVFQISGCRIATDASPNTSYNVTARPQGSGMPAFCTDQSGIVRADYGGDIVNCLRSGVPL
jgi:hypothetical protein